MPPERQQVADRNKIVVDPHTGVHRQIIAGKAIPPDLVNAPEAKDEPSVVDDGYQGGFEPVEDDEASDEQESGSRKRSSRKAATSESGESGDE